MDLIDDFSVCRLAEVGYRDELMTVSALVRVSRLNVWIALLAMMELLSQITGAGASERTLPISPVVQRSPVWCWAAVGEMVFRYFGSQNADPGGTFQCAIVEAMADRGTSPCARDCYSPNCVAGGRD